MQKNKGRNSCKIVATLGNIDGREDLIEKLYLAGASVFRLNLSHSPVSGYLKHIKMIRALEEKYNTPLCVVMDLQGPKLRVGAFKNKSVILKDGQKFQLDLNPAPGDETRVTLPHKEIYRAVKAGHRLLFNDGLIRVRVEKVFKDKIIAQVINGGYLSDRKGVNVPDVPLEISALTAKDKQYIKEADKLGVDYFALSFVQSPGDVQLARRLIKSKAGIISKIEKPHALNHLDKIIALSDAVMAARGDLGVELSPERVPVIQRSLIAACRRAGKPVIVATQMLESMISNVTPTRAEASDVATAVYQGADAVMLSAETASGRFPVESVQTMRRIISNVEADASFQTGLQRTTEPPPVIDVSYATTTAAANAVGLITTADVIVNFTDSGNTSLRTARQRPAVPILCLTPHREVARKMAVVWGVIAVVVPALCCFEDIEKRVKTYVTKMGFAKAGMQVVITAGVPLATTGGTNLMHVMKL
jgi:pyruvate kinase